MSENKNDREKYWQVKSGKLAMIANWALVELLETNASENSKEQAEEHLSEVVPMLDFYEEA